MFSGWNSNSKVWTTFWLIAGTAVFVLSLISRKYKSGFALIMLYSGRAHSIVRNVARGLKFAMRKMSSKNSHKKILKSRYDEYYVF